MSHSDTIKKILIAVGVILLVASNAFAETPRDEYLGTIDLEDLCIAYSKNHQGFWVAKVKDPDGHFHTVTVGSDIGKNDGIITKITNDTVDVIELIQDESTGDYFERTLTLRMGRVPYIFSTTIHYQVACPMAPPCGNSPSDGSPIWWLMSKRGEKRKDRFTRVHLGLSVGDRRAWRWADADSRRIERRIEPATSEEAKELKEHYKDADLSRPPNNRCPTSR